MTQELFLFRELFGKTFNPYPWVPHADASWTLFKMVTPPLPCEQISMQIYSFSDFFPLTSNMNLIWCKLGPFPPFHLRYGRRGKPPPTISYQLAVEETWGPPEPPLLQTKQPELPQLLLIRFGFASVSHRFVFIAHNRFLGSSGHTA